MDITHINACPYIFIQTCMTEWSPACKQAGVTLIGGRPNNFWFLLYICMYSELFTISMYYLYKQPYFYCVKKIRPVLWAMFIMLSIESQHTILMSEVAFLFFLLLLMHFSMMMIWSVEVLTHAHWRSKMIV